MLWHANPATVHAEDAVTLRFKVAIRDNSGNMIRFFGK
jgi:hypothetical protein